MDHRQIIAYIVPFLFGMAISLPTEAAIGNPAAIPASACTAAATWIDVRCYGAVGNGSADDTAAIGRALAAASPPTNLCCCRTERSK